MQKRHKWILFRLLVCEWILRSSKNPKNQSRLEYSHFWGVQQSRIYIMTEIKQLKFLLNASLRDKSMAKKIKTIRRNTISLVPKRPRSPMIESIQMKNPHSSGRLESDKKPVAILQSFKVTACTASYICHNVMRTIAWTAFYICPNIIWNSRSYSPLSQGLFGLRPILIWPLAEALSLSLYH